MEVAMRLVVLESRKGRIQQSCSKVILPIVCCQLIAIVEIL